MISQGNDKGGDMRKKEPKTSQRVISIDEKNINRAAYIFTALLSRSKSASLALYLNSNDRFKDQPMMSREVQFNPKDGARASRKDIGEGYLIECIRNCFIVAIQIGDKIDFDNNEVVIQRHLGGQIYFYNYVFH